MVRNLTILVLGGFLASVAFAGNAEACHKMGCRTKKVCCVTPPPCPPPVCCVPKVKKCCFQLPKFCHKRTCAPAPVACASGSCPMPSAQASAQH